MRVREIMTSEVETVAPDDSLQRAVGAMLQKGIGSVLVVDDDRPVGILTDSDVLRAGYLSERALPNIPVEREMSSPVETIHPDDTVDDALETMVEKEIKKLPVEESLEIVGIVTMTDIARSRPEAMREAVDLERDRVSLENDPTDGE